MISLIVAASENNGIGKSNQLLWHLPNDLKYFKNTTWGMPVIMGRKTFESVNKPLPGRINIVITSQKDWHSDNVLAANDLESSIRMAYETNCKEVFIIGGGEIYKQAFSKAEKIYLTRVHANLEADTFFPAIDESVWEQTGNLDFPADEKHAWPYTFQVWERRKS